MKIAGFKKQSLIDYPGNISSVVFTQGCNFRCGFCHNPDLVLFEKFGHIYNEEHIFDYLNRYKNLIDAVCITGGEPTIQYDLPDFIRKVKNLNLKVKLDSNGTNPGMLRQLFEDRLVDYIAMDIKHILEFDVYNMIVGNWINRKTFLKILESIELIENAEIDHEFRTTVIKGVHREEQIQHLKQQFGKNFKVQNFNPEIVLNPDIEGEPFPESEYKSLS